MTLNPLPATRITTYLHMTSPTEFTPAVMDEASLQGVVMMQMTRVDIPFYRFLYNTVGEQWRWRDRRLMSDDDLRAALTAPGVSIYVLYADGVPAGYVELANEGTSTELAFMGLRPEFMGRGLGKFLLNYGIARAWEADIERLWLHTCNLDGPHALANYLKRGFTIYDVQEDAVPERYKE